MGGSGGPCVRALRLVQRGEDERRFRGVFPRLFGSDGDYRRLKPRQEGN